MLIRGNLGRNRLDIQSGCLNDEKHLTVSAAATRSPREMPRRWESVQEEELKEEREVEGSALLEKLVAEGPNCYTATLKCCH